MKHVFIIHSSIADVMARSIIKHDNLSGSDCVLIFLRSANSKLSNNSKFLDLSKEETQYSKSIIKNRTELKKIVKSINNIVGYQTYKAYIPHSGIFIGRLLTALPLCTGFYYVEEGLSSYLDVKRLKQRYNELYKSKESSISKHVKNMHKNLSFGMSKKPYYINVELGSERLLGAYCINETAFPDVDEKIVISPEYESLHGDKINDILALDAGAAVNLFKIESELAGYRIILDRLVAQNISQLHYKRHPRHKANMNVFLQIKNLFKEYGNKIEFIELDDSVILEEIALSYKPNFYIIQGAVGWYAAQLGSQVFSAIDHVAAIDSRILNYTKYYPSTYWDVVEKL